MQTFVLFDPKTNKYICSGLLTHFQADRKNEEFRQKGRATRWIPKEQLPENAMSSQSNA